MYKTIFLDSYPLNKHYSMCREYLYNLDWSAKSEAVKKNGVIVFDISDVLNLFPHLELDEHYQLMCYLSSEYHGLYGQVAAIQHGSESSPILDPELQWMSFLLQGPYFSLPKTAVPPMEAIYNDGTPEGYFEAVLCEIFLSALPYTCFEKDHWNIILTTPPTAFNQTWDIHLSILDWQPRVIYCNDTCQFLTLLQRNIENGFGSSDGRDSIYLTQYTFQHDLALYHAFHPKTPREPYPGQIDDNSRYTDIRHCCVSISSSISVAKEKNSTAKFQKEFPPY